MAEESQYCNSRELYEARMKNYDDNIKTHEWTHAHTHTGAKTFRWQSLQHIYFSRSHQNSPAELVKTETRRRRAASGPRALYEARTKGWAIDIDDVFNIEQQLSGTEAQPQDSQVGNKDQIDS